MIGIIITQQLKDLNNDLFKNNTVGSIRVLSSVPTSFYSLTYELGSRTDGYHTLNTSIHQADGFYNIISPPYDRSIEKLGDIYQGFCIRIIICNWRRSKCAVGYGWFDRYCQN